MFDSPLVPLALIAVSLVLLRQFAWRAALCVRPQSVEVEVESPAQGVAMPGALDDVDGELKKLGFVLAGIHSEKSPFVAARQFVDWAHPTLCMSASAPLDDEEGRLTLLTQSKQGMVVTSNFRRPSIERSGRYLAGGLDGVSVERLLKAHLRRLPEIGAPVGPRTLDETVAALRTWYHSEGKAELRQQHAVGLLWSVGALGMVGVMLVRLLTGATE